MITLLIIFISLLVTTYGWVRTGWHFSLSAAPAAYELQKSNPTLKKVSREDQEKAWEIACSRWQSKKFRKQTFAYEVEKYTENALPEEAASKIGKKCVKWGPFAYFLTPEWKNKKMIWWTPPEVTASRLVEQTGKTLEKAKSFNELCEEALGDFKVNKITYSCDDCTQSWEDPGSVAYHNCVDDKLEELEKGKLVGMGHWVQCDGCGQSWSEKSLAKGHSCSRRKRITYDIYGKPVGVHYDAPVVVEEKSEPVEHRGFELITGLKPLGAYQRPKVNILKDDLHPRT